MQFGRYPIRSSVHSALTSHHDVLVIVTVHLQLYDMPRFYESRRDWADLTCSTCKHDYDGATGVALGEIGLAQVEGADEVDEEELSDVLANLGFAYSSSGDANRARELLERALAIDERAYGADHAEVAVTLTNLGAAYGDLGDANRQRELLERALVIFERGYGPAHRFVSRVRSLLQ